MLGFVRWGTTPLMQIMKNELDTRYLAINKSMKFIPTSFLQRCFTELQRCHTWNTFVASEFCWTVCKMTFGCNLCFFFLCVWTIYECTTAFYHAAWKIPFCGNVAQQSDDILHPIFHTSRIHAGNLCDSNTNVAVLGNKKTVLCKAARPPPSRL